MSPEHEALAYLKNSSPNGARLHRKAMSIVKETYDYNLFIDLIFELVDDCIQSIQQDRSLRQKEDQSEDLITAEIKNMINKTGLFSARLGEQRSGASDLLITCTAKNFEWSAEAKIHSRYDYLADGFRQITTRYSDCDFNNTSGGFLIYTWNRDVYDLMENWKRHLSTLNIEFKNLNLNNCKLRELSFYSQHKHDVSGLVYKVRHMPICLNHNPRDKAARDKAARQNSTNALKTPTN